MTDQAYTGDDLRIEAARQHQAATEDPDFSGIGEQMEGHKIASRGALQWEQLGEDDFDAAQRAIDDLLGKAADVSEWAINIGADGLEPADHHFNLKAGEHPCIRVHFAFASGLSDEAHIAFVEGLGAAAAREMQLALSENPPPTISSEVAAHVLFQERLGGWPPNTFASKLLNLWTSADTAHADHLADAFPEYAAAIALVKSGQTGITQLRAISGDS